MKEIDKWGYGINLAEALVKDIKTYIRVKIYKNETGRAQVQLILSCLNLNT